MQASVNIFKGTIGRILKNAHICMFPLCVIPINNNPETVISLISCHQIFFLLLQHVRVESYCI